MVILNCAPVYWLSVFNRKDKLKAGVTKLIIDYWIVGVESMAQWLLQRISAKYEIQAEYVTWVSNKPSPKAELFPIIDLTKVGGFFGPGR